jgi:predicted MFS family arabinose efflux permease
MKLPLNVWALMAAQSFNQSGASMVVLVGGLIGSQLAPSPVWMTVPVACMVIGTALATVPVSMSMQRWGRKPVFMAGTLFGMCGSLFAAQAIIQQEFFLFCAATILLGSSLAFGQQYRFAAMESVAQAHMPRAASRVLLAGLIAAFMGPELGMRGRELLSTEYSGSFVGLAGLQLLGLCCLLFYREGERLASGPEKGGRPLTTIMQSTAFWVAIMSATVGYVVMAFVMTATPVSMHVHHGYDLADTKWVIQSHIMAMYIPSLFSGWLISNFGAGRLMFAGCLLFILCIGVALAGADLGNFWGALILLGMAWNFMFISGTSLLPTTHRDEERFRVQGFNEFVVFGSQAVASLSSGLVLATIGWQPLLLLCLPMIGVQLALLYLWRRQTNS